MASAWSQLDQLLTCAICLDRYRNPKLLPCQHTFCMEPCLDGLIDYARRQIKCPECRAEHRIPYQGIQQFPTNVTLMRFLELHRDITGEEPEPPPSMMERCSVCSEKSNVEKCAHCDKKICPDCKEAHVDILRREINRINNQVRRGLHRLSEALTQTKKNAEKLQFNCNQVKDEIEDIVKRYSKDLKVTEEKLKHDLEIYTQNEMKSINKLKDDLEIEVTNISSNCDLVDKYVTDDFEWSDLELIEYKQIFIKMLDFLRTFDPDSTDFSRRIKFQPRADPDVLHRNIADFGELKINAPMNAVPTQQSLMPPTNPLMRSQSDHRLAAQFARRCDNRSFSDANQRTDSERDSGRPTSPLMGRGRRDGDGYRRYSERSRDYDYQDRVSSRYNRDDTALSSRWRDSDDYGHRNRYPRDYDECDSEPHQGRTVRFADEQSLRERIFEIDEASKGPLSGVFKLLDSPKVMERLHKNEVKQKQQQAEKEKVNQPQTPPVTAPAPQPVVQPKRQPSRQQSEDDIDRQKRANQQSSSSTSCNSPADLSSNVTSQKTINTDASRTASVPESPRTTESTESPEESRSRRRLSGTTTVDEPSTETPRTTSRFARSALVKTTSLDGGETSRKPLDKKMPPRAATPVRQDESESDDEDDDENDTYETAKEPPKPVQSSFFTRQRRLPDPEPRLLEMHESDSEEESESEEEEEDDDDEEEDDDSKEGQTTKNQETPAVATSAAASKTNDEDEEDDEDDDEDEEESSSSSSESESGESTDQVFQNASDVNSKKQSSSDSNDASNSKKDMNHQYEDDDSEDQDETSEKPSEDEGENEAEDYRSKISSASTTRRRPSPDLNSNRNRKRSDDTDTTDSSSASSSTNYHSLSRNTTPMVSPNGTEDRVSSEGSGNDSGTGRFRNRPFLSRSKSSHEIGLGYDRSLEVEGADENCEPSPPTYRSRSERKSEDFNRTRPSPVDTTSTTSNSCWAKYLKNKYGSNATGRVVPRSRSSHSLYQRSDDETSDDDVPSGRDPVLSSSYSFSNPRSTYMQKRRMMLKLGSRGTESGTFTWPRGVAVGPENSMVVADSSNHRIQVFDSIGKFLFEFGSYGSGEGEFDCPAGVSVNRIGQFIVSDRYNHRVQLFDPTGRFLRAFGCEGRTDGRFNYPWGIATDSLGFIYVCDKENHRIQVFQSDGTFVGKFGVQGGRPGQLEHPHYVAVTNTNRVVVTDTNNHRVQVFDVNGRSLSSFGSEGSADGQFKFPRGVAVDDQGFIIIGDSGNNRIQVFQPDGTFLRSFGSWGAGDGEFKGLEGLAVTSGGSIIACDRENHRIQVF